MRHLWQWLNGYVCILLRGRQLHRFINLCSKNGIQLWGIKRALEQKLQVHIRLKDIYYLKPFLRKTKTNFKILYKKGFPFWCYRHPKLKWMFVLLFSVLILFLYSFNYIWEIEIHGNQRISTYDIIQFLEKQEIGVGTPKERIDFTALEYQFRQNFHEIGWVSVYLDKSKLCIEVNESLYDELFLVDEVENVSYDLIADKDAIIYSIIIRNGEAVVSKGQIVSRGDTLVLGKSDIYDDTGIVKEQMLLRADALIYGDVRNQIYIPMTELEIIALKIAGSYSENSILFLANNKFHTFLKKIEENGVIILDKNVMINKEEKNIVFIGEFITREQIGINILAEEQIENEFK